MGGEAKRGIPWWKGAATHIWRTFFRYRQEGWQSDTDQKRKMFFLCNQILQEFNEDDASFLSGYFLTSWGCDEEYLTQYAARTGQGKTYLWRLVEDCNRRFFEEAGLLEKQSHKTGI